MNKRFSSLFVSATGISVILFMTIHVSINLFLVIDNLSNSEGNLYNSVYYFMQHNAIANTVEKILALGFVFHIVIANITAMRKMKNHGEKKDMIILGVLLLFFLGMHLLQFKVKTNIEIVYIKGKDIPDMYSFVAHFFSTSVFYGIVYMLSGIVLGIHLQNGFISMLDRVEIRPSVQKKLYTAIRIFSYCMMTGFFSIPLYFLLFA